MQSKEERALYSQASCLDASPHLFDEINPDDIYAKAALEYCSACPVTKECLMIVKPAESYFDGICGGTVWKNGQPARSKPKPIEPIEYLDEVAIERLITGDIDWKAVGIKERREAAWIMYKRGYSYTVFMEKTHLSGKSIKKLFTKKEGL